MPRSTGLTLQELVSHTGAGVLVMAPVPLLPRLLLRAVCRGFRDAVDESLALVEEITASDLAPALAVDERAVVEGGKEPVEARAEDEGVVVSPAATTSVLVGQHFHNPTPPAAVGAQPVVAVGSLADFPSSGRREASGARPGRAEVPGCAAGDGMDEAAAQEGDGSVVAMRGTTFSQSSHPLCASDMETGEGAGDVAARGEEILGGHPTSTETNPFRRVPTEERADAIGHSMGRVGAADASGHTGRLGAAGPLLDVVGSPGAAAGSYSMGPPSGGFDTSAALSLRAGPQGSARLDIPSGLCVVTLSSGDVPSQADIFAPFSSGGGQGEGLRGGLPGTAFPAGGSVSMDDVIMQVATHCPRLRRLCLARTLGVTDMSIAALASACPHLEHLDVAWCQDVSDASVECVAVGCPKLRGLCVSGCRRVTDHGLMALAERCGSLQHLDAAWCRWVGYKIVASGG
eukprot:jgi/Mesvir1/13151/Mv06120-RA.1